MSNKSKNTVISNKKNLKYIFLGIPLLLVTGTICLFIYNTREKNSLNNQDEAKTTSILLSAQENFSDGDERPVEEPPEDKGTATINDSNGSAIVEAKPGSWTTSGTSEITIYSPIKNQLINNGDILSGESTLDKVSFRIIDSISGVISEGQLSVTNGKFSGTVSFSTKATEGRFDIFGVEIDGREFGNIEIPVRFKP